MGPKPLVCMHVQPLLTVFNGSTGELSINDSALRESGFGSVRCSYQCFRMAAGQDFEIAYDQWVSWDRTAKVHCEFFHVSCSRATLPVSVYSNVFAQVW